MDLAYDVERDILEMGREETLSTLHGALSDLLAEALNPPPPLPPPSPAGLELSTHPQPAESQGGRDDAWVCEQQNPLTDVSALYSGLAEVEDMLQSLAHSQGQVVVTLSEGQSLCFAGVVEKKCENEQEGERPYVKKPPNAFMLFMKEQRPKVKAEIDHGGKGNAAVNTVLGRRWKSLTREQQAKYYHQAEKERQLHAQQYPQWSSSENYGKKRKRRRGPAPTTAEESPSKPEEVTEQAKRLCVSPLQTPLVETSSSSQLPLTHSDEPVCPSWLSWVDSPKAASTSQASTDGPAHTETESPLSEDDKGQYVAGELDALLQSLGGESEPLGGESEPLGGESEPLGVESELPPHTDLCTLDLDQIYS